MYIFIYTSAIYSTSKHWNVQLLCFAMRIISTDISTALPYVCV